MSGSILSEADVIVYDFVQRHRQAAIPALIAACVGWAIEHGAGDLMRATLTNSIRMSHDAEEAFNEELH